MIERAAAFGKDGEILFLNQNVDECTSGYIPDDPEFFSLISLHKDSLLGIAHTHPPGAGCLPSEEDLGTFSAIDAALGFCLLWPIIDRQEVNVYYRSVSGDYLRLNALPHDDEFVKIFTPTFNKLLELSYGTGK